MLAVDLVLVRREMLQTDDQEALVVTVTAMQQGDTNAGEDLYHAFIDKIYAYFYRRVYSKVLAEDLTSETFLAVFEQIEKFDPQRSTNVSWWIYRIAHNKLIDHRRKTKHTPVQLDEDWQATDYHPDLLEQTHAKHLIEKIGDLLSDMHPQAKQIVMMKLWEWMSHFEISNELQMKESNVRKIFSRSIKQLVASGDGLLLSFLIRSMIRWTY